MLFAVLWAALFVLPSCDLPGIPGYPLDQAGLDSDAGSEASCPATPRCGAGNFVEQCAEDGETFEVVSCGIAELCRAGSCEDVTGSCDATQGRPFRLSDREIAFDAPELLANCDCSGATGCSCNEVEYEPQRKSITIENCSSRPLYLQGTVLKNTSLRPDSTPVFVLAESYGARTIEPGRGLEISVIYRPAPGVSQLAGSDLNISLIGDSAEFFAVPLRTRSFCITATPTVDIWTLIPGQELTRPVVIQNCGTEPVTLTGAEVDGWKGPGEPTVKISEKLPFTLAGGDEADALIKLAPESPGLFEGAVHFQFAEEVVRRGATTVIRGAAAENGCSMTPLPALTSFANGRVLDSDLETVAPAALITMVPTTGPATLVPVYTLRDKPDPFLGRVVFEPDSATLFADVVGPYVIRYRAFDQETGLMTCEFEDVAVDVRPSAPLYVELTWRADGDSIVDDAGFGRGADLDLYVRATETGGTWSDSDTSCFPDARVPCSEAVGSRVSLSQSGWNPEAYRFARVEGLTFSFGAYLRNPYNFGGDGGGVRATLKVWRDGELVEAASLPSPAEPEESPRIRSANLFWWAASYEDESAIVIDSYQPGIP